MSQANNGTAYDNNNYDGYRQNPSIRIDELNEDISTDDSSTNFDSNQSLMESPSITNGDSVTERDSLVGRDQLANTFKQPPDLKYLASANFSSDSLPDSGPNGISSLPAPISIANTANFQYSTGSPSTPTFSNFGQAPYSPISTSNMANNIGVPFQHRRYSNSALTNSPVTQPSASAHVRAGSGTRPRPKSAIFMMDSNNYSISESGSPVNSPVQNNAPRSRSSIHFAGRTGISSNPNGGVSQIVPPPTGPASARSSRNPSPSRSTSPSRTNRHYRSKSPVRRSNSPVKYSPFNFKPQEVMLHNNGSNNSLSVKPAHRKGHKYKHSSVSMNLFQEPPPALVVNNQQEAIPDSYPIPNFRESLNSVKAQQKLKLGWSFCHFVVCVSLFLIGFHFKLPSFSTLAHLVFYDSLGSLIVVFVDIMSNFDVWNKSSIAYPFGLGRLEVLVGFALSASLIMVGCDLVSHFLEEVVIGLVVSDSSHDSGEQQHQSHHIHGGHDVDDTNWLLYEVVLCVVIGVTVVSSNYILASDRIGEMMMSSSEDQSTPPLSSTSKIEKLTRGKGGILDNKSPEHKTFINRCVRWWRALSRTPTRILTLAYCFYLILLPIVPASYTSEIGIDVDEITTLLVASLLCYSGWRLVKSLGGILLLSYPKSDYDYHVLKSSVIDKILTLECYKQSYNIEKLFITKFNYELFVVGLKITMNHASIDDESRLRFEVNRLVKSCLEKTDYNVKSSNIETTIDITRI